MARMWFPPGPTPMRSDQRSTSVLKNLDRNNRFERNDGACVYHELLLSTESIHCPTSAMSSTFASKRASYKRRAPADAHRCGLVPHDRLDSAGRIVGILMLPHANRLPPSLDKTTIGVGIP